MRKIVSALVGALFIVGTSGLAQAHFGMVIPSKPTVMEMSEANLDLDIKFWHPFANIGMNMEKPKKFEVFWAGKSTDLTATLKESRLKGFEKWTADYKIAKPGLYVFAVEPAPYWEAEEDLFIIHYTKAYVNAFGDDEGWADPIGQPAEIVPLTNPTGLYEGGLFTGRVMLGGKAVAGAEVEVEWYPGPHKKGVAPNETMITQSVVADENGVFNFVAVRPGWWGFAALHEADYKIKRDGQDKSVELGGVVWVYFHSGPEALPDSVD